MVKKKIEGALEVPGRSTNAKFSSRMDALRRAGGGYDCPPASSGVLDPREMAYEDCAGMQGAAD